MSMNKSNFSSVKRGYATDEVDQFMQTYVGPLEDELDAAREQIRSLEGEIGHAEQQDADLRLTLMAATKTEAEFTADAREHYETTVISARSDADGILGEARSEALTLIERANAEADAAASHARRDADHIVAEARSASEELLASAHHQSSDQDESIAALRAEVKIARADATAARAEAAESASTAVITDSDADAAVQRSVIAIEEANAMRTAAETLRAEAERTQTAAEAVRAGAVSGAAELRQRALANAKNTKAAATEEAEEVVTEANEKARAIIAAALAEAASGEAWAAENADHMIHDARSEALSIIDEIRAETEALLLQAAGLTSSNPVSIPPVSDEAAAIDSHVEDSSKVLEPVGAKATESASPPRDDEQDEYAGRKTFYARRSAGLPNIGASAVSEALAAVTAMRVDFVANTN